MHRHRIVALAAPFVLLAGSALALDPRLLRPEDGSNVPFAETENDLLEWSSSQP